MPKQVQKAGNYYEERNDQTAEERMKVDQVEEPDVGKEQRLAMARGLRSKLNSIWACIEKDDDVVKEMEIRLVARKRRGRLACRYLAAEH